METPLRWASCRIVTRSSRTWFVSENVFDGADSSHSGVALVKGSAPKRFSVGPGGWVGPGGELVARMVGLPAGVGASPGVKVAPTSNSRIEGEELRRACGTGLRPAGGRALRRAG